MTNPKKMIVPLSMLKVANQLMKAQPKMEGGRIEKIGRAHV